MIVRLFLFLIHGCKLTFYWVQAQWVGSPPRPESKGQEWDLVRTANKCSTPWRYVDVGTWCKMREKKNTHTHTYIYVHTYIYLSLTHIIDWISLLSFCLALSIGLMLVSGLWWGRYPSSYLTGLPHYSIKLAISCDPLSLLET